MQHLHQKSEKAGKKTMFASDIAGVDLFHWNGQNFLLVVDYHSKYREIKRLYSTISVLVIQKMKMTFSRLGIPKVVRSDNGTQYSSRSFKRFA